MKQRLVGILIYTTDLARAVRFYRDGLGLPLCFVDRGAGPFAECDLQGLRLEIHLGGPLPVARGHVVLFLRVAHPGAVVERLDAAGFAAAPGLSSGTFEIRDPDGNGVIIGGLGDPQRTAAPSDDVPSGDPNHVD